MYSTIIQNLTDDQVDVHCTECSSGPKKYISHLAKVKTVDQDRCVTHRNF